MRNLNHWLTVALVAVMAWCFGFALAPPVRALEEGHHLHFQLDNAPAPGKVIPRADYTFTGRVLLHNQPGAGSGKEGKTNYIRVSDYSTVKQSKTFVLGPCSTECSAEFSFTVNFGSWTCGQHELRWTVNIPNTFEGKRQFTTSRQYVDLAGCTTKRHDRTNWYFGGGGWYEGVDYAINVQRSPFSSVRPGGTVTYRVQSNANRGCLFANPDAHNGTMGRQIGSCWTGTGDVQRTIPSDLSLGTKIAQYAEDTTPSKQHAGLAVHKLGDAADGFMWMEWQDWWNTAGLSVP